MKRLFNFLLFFSLPLFLVKPVFASDININLDPSQPGAVANNVGFKYLYHNQYAPYGYGANYGGGSLKVPFQVSATGDYRLVITYALATWPKETSIKIDDSYPDSSWQNFILWPTSPYYPPGSTHLSVYPQFALPPVNWTVGNGTLPLTAGSHAVEFIFPQEDVVLVSAKLTIDLVPPNNPQPWFQAGYTSFPALDLVDRQLARNANGTVEITFNGVWKNLAPSLVSYTIQTLVMPRKGSSLPKFRVTSLSPSGNLTLDRGQSLPFTLTVVSSEVIADKYSEIILLTLKSSDIPNLSKPYLLAASNGYLDLDPSKSIPFLKGYQNLPLADLADPYSVVPTATSMGYVDGLPKTRADDAWVKGLASAATPVTTTNWNSQYLNLTDWAKAGAPLNWYYILTPPRSGTAPYQFTGIADGRFYWNLNNPLALMLAGLGGPANSPDSATSLGTAKLVANTFAQELPYYPVYRWDTAMPDILPVVQYERTGTTLLASYIKLVQNKVVSDNEHFRFLHNVVLPLYLAFRDDLRLSGTLAAPVKAGDTQAQLARDTPPLIYADDYIGEWLRIGTGANTEYVRFDWGLGRSVPGLIRLGTGFPGPFKYDHAAGEPWVSFHLREWVELEGTDIWSFLAAAAASRDSAVMEQVGEIIETIFATQNIFRADGSFANEAGSYGWGNFDYLRLAEAVKRFLGSVVTLSPSLEKQFLDSLHIWNQFPFSDGLHPMLNGGGPTNQLGRDPLAMSLLQSMYPQDPKIAKYQTIINQENNRQPGSSVNNWSYKVDGWGYAMLRGPGPWDSRIETLLSSKHLLYDPGDHVSNDSLGLVIFANGAMMTPRYGYHWINDRSLFVNRVWIDRLTEPDLYRFWGDFYHFDDNRSLPSAVAYTDMARSWSATPGLAHQERWLVQLPEYLFDSYFVKPRDGQVHIFEWGYRNLGNLGIVTPGISLSQAYNPDGSLWDPFGYYRNNTGHEGQGFTSDAMWQAEWTMNQGNVTYSSPPYSNYPQVGAKLRLTMAATAATNVVTAWLQGPGRNDSALFQQDFITVRRSGNDAVYIDTLEPLSPGSSPKVSSAEVIAQGSSGEQVVKVTTTSGVDWFLVGINNFSGQRSNRQIGPFKTDAFLAVVRIKNGTIYRGMFVGGSSFEFWDGGLSANYTNSGTAAFHFGKCYPPIGDLDCSGRVTSSDLSDIIKMYQNYDFRGDLNEDSQINNIDVTTVISNLGN